MKTIPQSVIAYCCDRIPAEQLTEGDVVLHFSSRILITTEPQYTYQGIVFDAMWLDVDSQDNTQQLCFSPMLLFDLVFTTPILDTHLAA